MLVATPSYGPWSDPGLIRMVKGNADRRRDLTRLRQEDERAELLRKSLGPAHATAAEARARLLSDAKHAALGNDESDLLGWVVVTAGDDGSGVGEETEPHGASAAALPRSFCEAFFRTGGCPLRRCKHAHDVTISALTGVPQASSVPAAAAAAAASEPAGGGSGPPGAIPAMHPMPLRACGGAGGNVVYDRTIRR